MILLLYLTGIEEHFPVADLREFMLYRIVFEELVFRKNTLKQLPQGGDVPLSPNNSAYES